MDIDARDAATGHLLRSFRFSHLPEELQKISLRFYTLAYDLVENFPDGPELTAGLRKLLEAKDCIVRHASLIADPREK